MPTNTRKALKRKIKPAAHPSRKKAKTQHLTADDLPWKAISHRHEAGLDNALEGMMELEEVEGVEVVYEDTENGKVVKFVSSNKISTFCRGKRNIGNTR